jgi:hypothetical protein
VTAPTALEGDLRLRSPRFALAVVLLFVGVLVAAATAVEVVRRYDAMPGITSVTETLADGTTRTTRMSLANAGNTPIVFRSAVRISVTCGPKPSWLAVASDDPAVASLTSGLLALPVIFWFWRRTRFRHARLLGVCVSAAVAAGATLLALAPIGFRQSWITPWDAGPLIRLVASCAAFAAAYLVAPEPTDRDESSEDSEEVSAPPEATLLR